MAERNTHVHFIDKIACDKFKMSNVLSNSGVCKQMQQDLKLPRCTQAEELQFFNSGGQPWSKTPAEELQFFELSTQTPAASTSRRL